MRARRLAVALAALGISSLPVHAQDSGRELVVQPDKGNCIACHQLPAGAGPATRSDLGPALEGARMRSIGRPALRELLIDPTRANTDSLMPPYGRHNLLDAAEIERIIDFLHALP